MIGIASIAYLSVTSTLLVSQSEVELPAQGSDSRVVNGELSKTCAWPATVSLGGCTGTLVHPRLVTYAAHCGEGGRTIRFGEGPDFVRSVSAECTAYPGGGNPEGGGDHKDYGFCILSEEVTDVPITPILYGCETEAIKIGGKAMVVGFGATKSGQNDGGVQREVEVTIDRLDEENGKVSIGGNGEGKGSCYGDSGGPLYIQLPESIDPDRSWRVFGVTSYGDDEPNCTGQAWYGLLHDVQAVPWMEETSGIDITPCHDVDGTWNPGPDCGGFPISPGDEGNWDNMCVGEVTGMSSSCGPAFDEESPTASLVSPADGALFELGQTIEFEVEASDNIAVTRVDVIIDEEVEFSMDAAPWVYSTNAIDADMHVVWALVVDAAGNEFETEKRNFWVMSSDDQGDDTHESDENEESDDDGSHEEDSADSESDDDGDPEASDDLKSDDSPNDDSPNQDDSDADTKQSGGCAVSGQRTPRLWFMTVVAGLSLRRRQR